MCVNCDPSDTYNYNWYNTDGLPCTTCNDNTICAKKMPAKCVIYNGTILSGLGLDTNIDIETILATVGVYIANLKLTDQQDVLKFTNILVALNDINARLKVLENSTHADYVI